VRESVSVERGGPKRLEITLPEEDAGLTCWPNREHMIALENVRWGICGPAYLQM